MTKRQLSRSADHRTQSERFIETARELGADEDDAAFEEKLAVIARQKPKGEPKTSTLKE